MTGLSTSAALGSETGLARGYRGFSPDSDLSRASSELVFSEPFNATGAWSLDTGLAISGGTLNQTGASGTLRTAVLTLPGLIDGRSYRVTLTVAGRTSGLVRVYLGGTAGAARLANGTVPETIVAGATGMAQVQFSSSANTGINVDNLIIEEL